MAADDKCTNPRLVPCQRCGAMIGGGTQLSSTPFDICCLDHVACKERAAQRSPSETSGSFADVARAFLRSYEAFDPNGRGQLSYPTPEQAAAIEAHLIRVLAAVDENAGKRELAIDAIKRERMGHGQTDKVERLRAELRIETWADAAETRALGYERCASQGVTGMAEAANALRTLARDMRREMEHCTEQEKSGRCPTCGVEQMTDDEFEAMMASDAAAMDAMKQTSDGKPALRPLDFAEAHINSALDDDEVEDNLREALAYIEEARRVTPYMRAEIEAAERNEALDATCCDCMKRVSSRCRDHFVADIEDLRAQLAALVDERDELLGRLRNAEEALRDRIRSEPRTANVTVQRVYPDYSTDPAIPLDVAVEIRDLRHRLRVASELIDALRDERDKLLGRAVREPLADGKDKP